MAAHGVFLSTARGVLATVRSDSLLVAALHPQDEGAVVRSLRFQLLTEPEALAAVASSGAGDNGKDNANDDAEAPAAPAGSKRITAFQFFHSQEEGKFAVLLLVNERQLVHYELDVAAQRLLYRSSRSMPRNANGLTLARVCVGESDKHAVLVSEKTGEAVAMPFPDIARGLKTLLGHTTSMITHMALTRDSQLLITADRDEKIRVSRFPQTSIVESYCLGHKASITRVACVHFLQTSTDLLVSTSLDNTLKLWSVASGELFDSHAILSDEEVADDDKSLLTVSLAASPAADVVAVLVNNRTFRVFEIVAKDGSYSLKPLEALEEDKTAVTTGEPCEVTFTEDGKLVMAFKKAPYVQVFDLRLVDGELRITAAIPSDNSCYSELRQAASTIELTSAEDEILDELEDGLKKKKVRTEWKARVLGGGN